jgi:thiosulfate/3-mercaptopyruvate sulfurtransferase
MIMKTEKFFIEASELLTIMDNPDLRIFDVTIIFFMNMSPAEAAKMPTAHELYQAGHLPGAAFLDHEDFSDLDSDYEYMLAADEILEKRIGEIGISNDSEVIVYATSPLACATRAWWMLRYAGVENVRVLNGGLTAWKNAGGAVEQGENEYAPAKFKAQFRREMIASLAEVQAAIEDKTAIIEDSLPQEWHDQEHIPGSTCLPITNFTDESWQVLLPIEDIRAQMAGVSTTTRVITYCGGGIAATLNAMVHMMMGNQDVAIYDGSLYEWKGEKQPVASNL